MASTSVGLIPKSTAVMQNAQLFVVSTLHLYCMVNSSIIFKNHGCKHATARKYPFIIHCLCLYVVTLALPPRDGGSATIPLRRFPKFERAISRTAAVRHFPRSLSLPFVITVVQQQYDRHLACVRLQSRLGHGPHEHQADLKGDSQPLRSPCRRDARGHTAGRGARVRTHTGQDFRRRQPSSVLGLSLQGVRQEAHQTLQEESQLVRTLTGSDELPHNVRINPRREISVVDVIMNVCFTQDNGSLTASARPNALT